MCGFIGAYEPKGRIKYGALPLKYALGKISHRGPDSFGIYENDFLRVGHARLKIIDLHNRSNQPMISSDKNIILAYNGEIYNYKLLKLELEKLNFNFITDSDTEVIINAYKAWGADCVKKFHGMFAFCLYDNKANFLYLARDPFGIKPLYYTVLNNEIVFSSEIKGILYHPDFIKKVNLEGVSSFLSFRQPINYETCFENIYMIPPAALFQYSSKGCQKIQYWALNDNPVKFSLEIELLKNKIQNSISNVIVSDVPICTFLSGGLDSSIIASELSKIMDDTTAYTIRINMNKYDESKYAEIIAKHFNLKHKIIDVDSDEYLTLSKELVKIRDQPLAMHNEVALYFLSKNVRQDFKVALSGEGADELFGGYGRIFRSVFEFIKQPYCFINRNFSRVNWSRYMLEKYSYFPMEEKKYIFNSAARKHLDDDDRIYKYFKGIFYKSSVINMHRQLFKFFMTFHIHGLLVMMDSMTMANSVEVRFPYLDHELAEYAYHLPYNQKIRWNNRLAPLIACFMNVNKYSENLDTTKYFLKKSYKNVLPKEIVSRKKEVFPVPLTEWFLGKHKDHLQTLLLGNNSKLLNFFDKKSLSTWLSKSSETKNISYGRCAWMLLNIEYWLREFF